MKQVKTSRVDRGWEKIMPVLDKELPLKKDKRRAAWLWLLPLMAGLIGLGYYVLTSSETLSGNTNDLPLSTQNITPVTKETTTQEPSAKLSTESVSKNNETRNEETRINETRINERRWDIKKTSKTTTLKETPSNEATIKKQETSVPLAASDNLAPNAASAIPNNTKKSIYRSTTNIYQSSNTVSTQASTAQTAKQSSANKLIIPSITKTREAVSKSSATNIASLAELQSLSIALLEQDLRKVPQPKYISLSPNTRVANNPNRWKPSLALAGFYAPQLKTNGLEASLALESSKNKWTYGITLGAGYYFKNFTSNTTSDSILLVNEALLSDIADPIPLPDYKQYLLAGLGVGYQLHSHLTLIGQLGVERYFMNRTTDKDFHADELATTPLGGVSENELDTETIGGVGADRNAAMQKAPIGSNWQPYGELSLAYEYKSWSLETGYRTAFNSVFSIDTQTYNSNKLFLKLQKHF